MGKKLNNTAALVGRPPRHGESHSVSCRGIENGFVTRVESSDPATGRYDCREVYSKDYPKISAPQVKGDRAGAGKAALGEAVSLLNQEPSGIGGKR